MIFNYSITNINYILFITVHNLNKDMINFILDKYCYDNMEIIRILNNISKSFIDIVEKIKHEIKKREIDKIKYKQLFLEKEKNLIILDLTSSLKYYKKNKPVPIKSDALVIISNNNKKIFTSQNQINFAKWFFNSKLSYIMTEFDTIFDTYNY